MRKLFLLLISMLFTSVFLSGQIEKREINENGGFLYSKSSYETKKLNANRMRLKHNDLKSHKFQIQQSSTIESIQAIKFRLDSENWKSFDEISNQWINSFKSEYTYNTNGILIQEIGYDWSSTNSQWIYDYQSQYFSDENGNLTQAYWYTWESSNNQWIIYSKDEIAYDTNDNVIVHIGFIWDTIISLWEFDVLNEFLYDGNSNLTEQINYEWDSILEFVPHFRYVYSYDTNGNLIQVVYYYWDANTNQWLFDAKDDRTYDATGNIIQCLHYGWDSINNQWFYADKTDFIFDLNGNLTQITYCYWDNNINQFLCHYKEECYYDNSISFLDLILPYNNSLFWDFDYVDYKIHFRHKLIDYNTFYWDENSSLWVGDEKGNFYYSELITSINENEDNEVRIYPNPASDFIKVEIDQSLKFAKVELYDMLGHKVVTHEISGSIGIPVGNLKNGLYIYKITSNDYIHTGKIEIK